MNPRASMSGDALLSPDENGTTSKCITIEDGEENEVL